MKSFSVVLGFLAVGTCIAQADLKLTVSLQIRHGLLSSNLTSGVKSDPKTAKEFEKDMRADPMTALMLGEPVTITEWWSKDKGRIDLGPITFLVTHKPERVVSYNRKTKTVTSLDSSPDKEDSNAPVQTTDTHRTRVVAGYKTKEYTLSGKDSEGNIGTAHVWVAANLQRRDTLVDPVLSQIPANLRAAARKLKGAILRTVVQIDMGEAGTKTLSSEVTHIANVVIPDSIFAVPPGYRNQ